MTFDKTLAQISHCCAVKAVAYRTLDAASSSTTTAATPS